MKRALWVLLAIAGAALAQNPPANPPTTTTDPTGRVCAANSVLNYLPFGYLFSCDNTGHYVRVGSAATGTVTSVAPGSCLKSTPNPIVATGTIALDGAVTPQTSTYQVIAADFAGCKTITVASGTFTITLVASGSQPAAGQFISILNYGSGTVTVARSGQNVNGGTASLTIGPGSATSPSGASIKSDGTNYFALVGSSFPATTCTNQFVRSLATGTAAGTCETVDHASIAATAVTPGSYTAANITVAADGSITAAANGSSSSLSAILNVPVDLGGSVVSLPQNSVLCQDLIVPVQSVLTSANTFSSVGAGVWSLGILQSGTFVVKGSTTSAPGVNTVIVSAFGPTTLPVGAYSICITSSGAADAVWVPATSGGAWYGNIANAGLSSPNLHYYQCANPSVAGVMPNTCGAQTAFIRGNGVSGSSSLFLVNVY